MKPLLAQLHAARKSQYALGHFNISTIDALWAIIDAAIDLNVPVVIGVSEGERDFIGLSEVASLVHSIRHRLNHPIYLNADHTYTLDGIKKVVAAGYDSVIFDAANQGLDVNINQTKEVVSYVKSQNPGIIVEAEVGYIGSSSKLLDEVPDNAVISSDAMPSVEDIKSFVTQTQVDCISPAVGNIHGMLKHSANPNLNTSLIGEIYKSVDAPIVLHGGSGISDKDFVSAIKAGVSMVHINTEIRRAWRQGIEQALSDHPDEVAPYKLLSDSKQNITRVVLQKLRLFHRL